METNDPGISANEATQQHGEQRATDVDDPSPSLGNRDGADPKDVRTNIGATSGVIPSSYGAGGDLTDAGETAR